MKILVTILCILIYANVNAFDIPAADLSCMETAMTQFDMNQCSIITVKEIDKVYFHLLEKITSNLDKVGMKEFEGMQDVWWNKVQSECKGEHKSYEGGTMQGMIYGSCITHATIERVIFLSDHYFCKIKHPIYDCKYAKKYKNAISSQPNN